MSTPALRIDAVGPQVTIQDLGRPGHASLGVTEGGAADRLSLRRANRLVGNAEDAAALEILIGGLEVTDSVKRPDGSWSGFGRTVLKRK